MEKFQKTSVNEFVQKSENQISLFQVSEISVSYKPKFRVSERPKVNSSRLVYDLLLDNWNKDTDPSRLVNAVSRWALQPTGDIYDIHTYGTELRVAPDYLERATALGEFGGIGHPVEGHLWNPKMRNWGYQTYHSKEELIEQYKHKFNQIVEMKKTERFICRSVYPNHRRGGRGKRSDDI